MSAKHVNKSRDPLPDREKVIMFKFNVCDFNQSSVWAVMFLIALYKFVHTYAFSRDPPSLYAKSPKSNYPLNACGWSLAQCVIELKQI